MFRPINLIILAVLVAGVALVARETMRRGGPTPAEVAAASEQVVIGRTYRVDRGFVQRTGKAPGDEPYRRRIPTFQASYDAEVGGRVVEIGRLAYDMSDFSSRYEPGHPAADESGFVQYPNVNTLVETVDMRQAQRSYEANLNVVTVSRQMLGRTLDILRG